MAKPDKRETRSSVVEEEDPRRGPGAKASTTSRRVTPPKAKLEQSSRYTAKGTQSQHQQPSPQWVPVLMFALWGVGLLIIILNYMVTLPGANATGSGWYLIAGLIALLGGIVVATQYR